MATKQSKVRAKWLGEYRAYEGSGLSIKEFCQERDINVYSFRDWRKRLGKEEGLGFRELSPQGAAEASYMIVLRNGRELRLSAGFLEARVRQLVGLLESC